MLHNGVRACCHGVCSTNFELGAVGRARCWVLRARSEMAVHWWQCTIVELSDIDLLKCVGAICHDSGRAQIMSGMSSSEFKRCSMLIVRARIESRDTVCGVGYHRARAIAGAGRWPCGEPSVACAREPGSKLRTSSTCRRTCELVSNVRALVTVGSSAA